MLTFAHSPDGDDLAMWWALLVGRPAARTLLRFEFFASDIETLNRRAVEVGDLDVTALSARAVAEAAGRYAIATCGASFGEAYGPKVVARPEAPIRCEGCLAKPGLRVAIPGTRTTAFLALALMMGLTRDDLARFTPVPFDRIVDEVASGRFDAGLIIHEAQLSFADHGLREVVDLGEWWAERTGLPLPLGLTGVRHDLDARHGPGTTDELVRVLRASVEHALTNRDDAVAFALARAPGSSEARMRRFLDMYANRLSLDMGERGRQGVRRLLAEGASAGLCPEPQEIRFIG